MTKKLIPKAQFGTELLKKGLRWISNHSVPTREQTLFSVQNTTKQSKPRELRDLQQDLKDLGYYTKIADNKWGNGTRAAIRQAEADGYKIDIKNFTISGKKSKKQLAQKPIKTSGIIKSLSLKEAQKKYQNGAGDLEVYASGIFHAIEGTGLIPLPHSDKLKDQIAAEIAYTEGLPESKREKDPHKGVKGTYIGYATHGLLSNQSGNINEQGNQNNAVAKIMGGYRYIKNPDGSVDVIDPFSFDVIRNFGEGKDGKSKVIDTKDDPYAHWILPNTGALIGLGKDLKDIIGGASGSVQDVAENYFTRLGRKRSNNIHFAPGEIDRRNNGTWSSKRKYSPKG